MWTPEPDRASSRSRRRCAERVVRKDGEVIRTGLQIPSFSFPGVEPADLFERVAQIATTAEESGFDSVFVMDHFFQLPGLGRPDEPMFECYTLLSALAARTRSVKVGAMVGGVTYRNPAVLAKESRRSTSSREGGPSGRSAPPGTSWSTGPSASSSARSPSASRSSKRRCRSSRACSRTTSPTSRGAGTRCATRYNVPKPIQPGGPPVLIGGSGERKTLRLVAQYADACNVFGAADAGPPPDGRARRPLRGDRA